MRIIGGKHKGRRLKVPFLKPTRPTTDIAKEALFNIIGNYYNFDNISFLDLFAGTGCISYEFGSRGCTDITSIEIYPQCYNFIRNTSEQLGLKGHTVLPMDVFKYINSCKRQFDVIFAGPPYPLLNLDEIPDLIFQYNLVEGYGWFILEHDPSHNFDNHPHFDFRRNYGQTNFSVFTNKLDN